VGPDAHRFREGVPEDHFVPEQVRLQDAEERVQLAKVLPNRMRVQLSDRVHSLANTWIVGDEDAEVSSAQRFSIGSTPIYWYGNKDDIGL
jgi:hypothetical protein